MKTKEKNNFLGIIMNLFQALTNSYEFRFELIRICKSLK